MFRFKKECLQAKAVPAVWQSEDFANEMLDVDSGCISFKDEVHLWRTVLRHLTLMYISQYPPSDIGNSFCLVVRIFGSEPKGPRFYSAAKVVTRGQRTRNNSFQFH
ncbi:hypothetical protein AVEN_255337-1 [Araneus ventricosus]|uniref:Uncharacterized protein n=1 Tax=Araneus ventricosus TaxID=182803 RepID=A0A4Y2H1F0_ARAVE|nr:hypothetical protein AVEN_255337-1 [Araneus ventricosus]